MLIGEGKRPQLYNFMKKEIAAGRQVFVVYPLIFESEKVDYQNLEAGYENIVSRFPFPPYKVAIVHGQQTSEVKQFNMDAFSAGRANILVSTTVIEVGVDVPNASVMVIESAERFGPRAAAPAPRTCRTGMREILLCADARQQGQQGVP